MSIGIYKITSPSGKVYIGQSINIEIRWKYSYNNFTCKQQPKLFNSLNKYGFDAHKFEIIEECLIEQLNERETYWKQYYLSQVQENWKKLLFCELHDSGGGPKSEETKRKIGEGNKGRIHSIETKNKMSEKAKGRKYSIEIKQKISNAKKGKIFSLEQKKNMKGKRCKPINQYDLNMNFITEWTSFKEITQHYGFNNTGLCLCCKNLQKTAYGFIWKYKN